jgi:hypothetical protein
MPVNVSRGFQFGLASFRLRGAFSFRDRLPPRRGNPQMRNSGLRRADRVSMHGCKAGSHHALQHFECKATRDRGG